jgi:hypothetical protein
MLRNGGRSESMFLDTAMDHPFEHPDLLFCRDDQEAVRGFARFSGKSPGVARTTKLTAGIE